MKKIIFLLIIIMFLLSCKTIQIKHNLSFNHNVDFFEVIKFALMSNLAYKTDEQILDFYKDYNINIGFVNSSNIKYFILTNKITNIQYISIQGTKNFKNIILDMEFSKRQDSKLGIYLHKGFEKAAYEVLSDILQKKYLQKKSTIQLTGHSLGGAIAVIIAMYLKEEGYIIDKIITFGQPKVTNYEGVQKYNQLPLIRVINLNDEVTFLPPENSREKNPISSYIHFGAEVILLNDYYYVFLENPNSESIDVNSFWENIKDENLDEHHIANYLKNIIPKLHNNSEIQFFEREMYMKKKSP